MTEQPIMIIKGVRYSEAPYKGDCRGCAFEHDLSGCQDAYEPSIKDFGGDCLERGVMYKAAQ